MRRPSPPAAVALLTPAERATLAAVADAFIPETPEIPGLAASASELGTPERIEEAARDVLAPEARRGLRLALRLLESPVANLLLVGRPVRFSDLDGPARERYLLTLADSSLADKRRMVTGLRKLAGFLHYTDPRVHAALGYRSPPASPEPAGSAVPLPEWDGRPVDAVVVGSGAGGGVAAALLARAGRRVLVVEAGPLRTAESFDGDEARGNRDLYAGGGALTTSNEAITVLAGAAAGGGTTVNWMTSLAPPPWLRAEWEQAGIAGCAGPEFDAHVRAVQERANVGVAESDLNGANRVLAEGAAKLGWKEGEDWSRLPRNARGCASRCDFCVFGCPWNAKQGTLVTWLADAAAAGARFLFRVPVDRVLLERGVTRGVGLADGREVRAPTVVLAAGAIGTAALLLRSGIRSPGIGRLFLHPVTSLVATFPFRVAMWEGPPQSVAVHRMQNLDGRHHGVLLETAPGHPGLSAASLPWRGGLSAKRDMSRLAQTAALIAIARDERPGQVRLLRDGRPRIDYAVAPADGERLMEGLGALARIAVAAGADGLSTLHTRGIRREGPNLAAELDGFVAEAQEAGVRPHGVGLFSAHQMGTCALGRDGEAPADAATGRLWDVEGLYVMDGSAFPSPSGVNPMVGILALAHRNAGRLALTAGPARR